MVQSSTLKSLRQFVALILRFQQKNGYIFSAWGLVRLVEHHILIELDRPWLMRPSDLALRLHQPAAQIAHLLRSLKRQGLVREVAGDTEREKYVLLTKKGRALSWKLDDISNLLMNLLARNIDYDEQRRFYEFWEVLNNGLSAPRTVARPGDHPLRLQTRRFTRVFGYFTRRAEPSALSFPELHILFALSESAAGVSLTALADILQTNVSTLRKLIQKLYEMDLSSPPSTKAGKVITITPKGVAYFQGVLDLLASALQSRLPEATAERLATLAPVFELAVSKWVPSYDPRHLIPEGFAQSDFFVQLQTQTLYEFARSNFGVLHEPIDAQLLSTSKLLVFCQGPTPCFCARVQCFSSETGPVIRIIDCGFSNRSDWRLISAKLARILLELGTSSLRMPGTVVCNVDEADTSGHTDDPQVIRLEFTAATRQLRELLQLRCKNIALDS